MKYLLDTHIILWALVDDKRISPNLKKLLVDINNETLYSTVSSWEVALKHSKKESFSLTEDQFIFLCENNGLINLPINNKHILNLKNIIKAEDIDHKDPFDLMLLAQAISENAILITHDKKFRAYGNSNIMIV